MDSKNIVTTKAIDSHQGTIDEIIGLNNLAFIADTDLNERGMDDRGSFLDLAFKKAESLSLEIGYNLLALTIANKAYFVRHETNDLEEVLGILKDFKIYKDEKVSGLCFGPARIAEETALAYRYAADATDMKKHLKIADKYIQKAIEGYFKALENPDVEIVGESMIRNRHLRCLGISATIYQKLAEMDDNPVSRKKNLEIALGNAELELYGRDEDGETKGPALLNSYHIVGVILGELGRFDTFNYVDAEEYFDKAQSLIDEHDMSPVAEQDRAVLSLRRAWIKYNQKAQKDEIREHLNNYTDRLQSVGKAVQDALEPQRKIIESYLKPKSTIANLM